jgi:hypothetical protein
MSERTYDVSPERRMIYHIGQGASAVGLLLFLSNFCVIGCELSGTKRSAHTNVFNDHGDFFSRIREGHEAFERHRDDSKRDMAGFVFRGVGGFILIALGGFLMSIGRHGLAGAGVTLNPQKARKDLEPHNRAAGGMLNDALEEVDVLKSLKGEPTVKVRCRSCSALNDEAAKFCNQCGKPV